MPPPRLQCLNAARQVSRKVPCVRAGFSTSSIARADDGFQPRSANDMLNSLGSPPKLPTNPTSFANPGPTRYQNITLPVGRSYTGFKRTPPSLGSKGPTSLLDTYQKWNRDDQSFSRTTPSGLSESSMVAELKNRDEAKKVTRMISRRFKAGDVYAPHDLSEVEMQKWKRRSRPDKDAFDVLDMNPIDHYRNFALMSEYMSDMGRIKHSKETGLRPVNQRRIAKAIRRSIGIGLMPSVHKHPEILQKFIARQLGGSQKVF